MSEILKEAGVVDDSKYDVILYDVLGDVVCGGFAAPLRQGFADKVAIVTSEELMSLYAANNIAKAVRNYSSNGISLIGLIANLRDPGCDHEAVSRFASTIGTKVLRFLPRDPAVRQAEYEKKTVIEVNPDSELVARLRELADILLSAPAKPVCIPRPMTDVEFNDRSRRGFRREGPDLRPEDEATAVPLAAAVGAATIRVVPAPRALFAAKAAPL
jgi:nitrogenase iron protein NifH